MVLLSLAASGAALVVALVDLGLSVYLMRAKADYDEFDDEFVEQQPLYVGNQCVGYPEW